MKNKIMGCVVASVAATLFCFPTNANADADSISQSDYDNLVRQVNKSVTDAQADKVYYAMSDFDAVRVRMCEGELSKSVRVKSGADAHKVCVILVATDGF